MKKLYTLLAFAVVMLVAHDGFAQIPTPLYTGYQYSGNLDEIDTTGGTLTVTSTIALTSDFGPVNGVYGLALDPTDEQMYVLYESSGSSGWSGTRRLGMLDPSTGSITDVGNMTQAHTDIEFDGTGQLYSTGNSYTGYNLYSVDKTTAASTYVLAHASSGSNQALGYNPATDEMIYGAGCSFSKVNMGTLGQTTVSSGCFSPRGGVVVIDANTAWFHNSSSTVYSVNLTTGASSTVPTSGLFNTYRSMAFGAQPCDVTTVDVTDDMVCTGDPVTLTITSTPAGTMTWDGGVTDGVPFIPPTGVTTYTATSTDPNDCPFSIDIYSTDVPTIVPNASATTICELTDLTLFGSGGDSYVWDMGVTDNVAFVPSGSGIITYSVIGSLMGCEAPAETIDIDVVAAPTVDGLATPNNLCVGETFVLTSSGTADDYDWGVVVTEGAAIPADAPGTYVYTVVGSETATGCSNSDNVTVVVNDAPDVGATVTETVVCEGEEVTFTGTGADSYTWDMGVTDGSPMQLSTPGVFVFTVTGADGIGCESTDEITVTVLDAPDVSGVVTAESFGFDGSIDLTATGGSGSLTYAWDHGPIVADLSGLVAGDYTVTVTDGACSTTTTFTVISGVGIDDANLTNLSVYPNPASENLFIDYEGEFTFELIAINGDKVLTGNGVDNKTISLNGIADGVYVLNVNSTEGSAQIRVVKN